MSIEAVITTRIKGLEARGVRVDGDPKSQKGVKDLQKLKAQLVVLTHGICSSCRFFEPSQNSVTRRVALKCRLYLSPTDVVNKKGNKCSKFKKQ